MYVDFLPPPNKMGIKSLKTLTKPAKSGKNQVHVFSYVYQGVRPVSCVSRSDLGLCCSAYLSGQFLHVILSC